MFAVLALPLLAGCFWNKTDKKTDVVESTVAQEAQAPESATDEMPAEEVMGMEEDEK